MCESVWVCVREREKREERFKGIVYPLPQTSKNLSAFTNTHVVSNRYDYFFHETQKRNFEDKLKRMQKHHESITKVVHMT